MTVFVNGVQQGSLSLGAAQCLANINGNGTDGGGGLNLASTGRDAAGEYTATWTIPMADAFHTVQVTVENAGARMGRTDGRLAGSTSIETMDNTFANVDVDCMVAVFGTRS
tara:strand:+ start:226 stop:558 length:333 start_codon:yes stop_codon:yes gene_type:complete